MSGLLCIGECMIELSGGQDDLYRGGFAGDTLNTAWHARAHLAGIPVAYYTAVGTDRMSDRMLDFFGSADIDTSDVRRIADRRPGLYMIEQRDGDRHFTYWRENSAARLLAEDADHLRRVVQGRDLVYLSGITLAILSPDARDRLLDALRDVRVAFDPNIRPVLWESPEVMRDVIMRAAALSDIVLPSFDDEAVHFGDADPQATVARYAAANPAAEIVVKDGPKPAHVRAEGRDVLVEVPPVTSVVDATGAGDSFNGRYLAERLSGTDPEAAARAAISTSGQVIGHHGAIPRN
ncbi:sugar kinase [Paracoccus sp. 1_MG-2023]|uniref:sugar kinase n=1 Tax=unclassified Paracoccus (in: a-proteobacteria) TaxID=2688777 RepID=UPI001C08AE4C|nr:MULTISPECIES: sugar kinase [unclassified Paracoccus (in: a-proteobacteria)]MBU2957727.1 sugar kinase [Paracoccus sp. C2R09]MDO6667425.1 sugar kinase [Paracoccus sp. 1_MG-2023]